MGKGSLKTVLSVHFPESWQFGTTPNCCFGSSLLWAIYLQVSPNGYLSLGKTFSKANPFADGTFPAYTPIIAPYWTDLDAPSGTQGGLCVHVYSEFKTDENRVQIFGQVKTDIAEWRGITFTPVFVFVATWEKALSYPAYLFNKYQVRKTAARWSPNNSSFIF